MRWLRALSCALLLAVLASPSSAQSGSSQEPAAPAAGQTPQNPIQEATQPGSLSQQQQQQQLQQAAEAARGKPSTFDIGGAGAGEQDQELGEVRLMTRYSQINSGSADGLARSFHTPGENNLAEANYFLDRRLFDTGHRFQLLSMFRGTDDASIDPEHNSLQKGFVRIYGRRDEFIFGDALVNYSRLTFNQNIKGVSASWMIADKWKMSAVGGVFVDRWGSLFKNQPVPVIVTDASGNQTAFGCIAPPTPTLGAGLSFSFIASKDPQCGRPFTAAVSGARLEYAFARDSAIAFNFSSSNDLVDTRSPLPANYPEPFPSPLPASNRVGSIDFKYQYKGLRMDGEYAYSATNFDTRAATCTACLVFDTSLGRYVPDAQATAIAHRSPTPGLGVQGDWGARFEASYRFHKLNLRASYVRYQPIFASINARQIADLQDFLARASYDLLPWLTVDGTVRRNNNDLKDQLPFQTTIWGPEGRLIFHDLSFYRRASLEVGYRHRLIQGIGPIPTPTNPADPLSGLLSGCTTIKGSSEMGCIDRYLRQPFVELTLPISTTFLTLGYERRQSVDLLKAGQSNNTDRLYAAFRGIYDFGGWHISPNLRYEMERQNHRLDEDTYLLPTTAAQYINPYQFLFLVHDSNRLATASVYVEAPKWFILEAGFRDTSATITVPAIVDVCLPGELQQAGSPPACAAGLTPAQKIVNGPSGYSRPSYRLALTYKLLNDENKVLIFSFERNNNYYFAPPKGADYAGFAPHGLINPLNFDERIMGVTFVYKFGKRGR